ncbi:MAG: hypothetical protein ACE145_02580 [Terriglobia bacterium]
MSVRFPMTPARLAANRRNARKSTGPRTEQGKRRVAGSRRRVTAPNPALPAERLYRDLAEAFRPADAAERLLVEELARLHARKRANQDAQAGLVRKNWEKLARERREHQLELTLEHSDHPAPLAVAAGYMQMEDSPAKFRQISRMLSVVREDVRLGVVSGEGERVLKTIYGPCPSMRGAGILANYRMLLKRGYTPQPLAPEPAPAEAADGDSTASPPGEEPGEERAARLDRQSLESVRETLLGALEEEKVILGAKYAAFLKEHVPPLEALKRAALVPADELWHSLLQQDQALDRQIESKTRLLLFVQSARRRQLGRKR